MKRPVIFIALPVRTAVLIGIAVLIGVVIYAVQVLVVTTLAPVRDVVSGKTVAIDAGHGGPDSGARGKSGIIEKDINLHIALELRQLLGGA